MSVERGPSSYPLWCPTWDTHLPIRFWELPSARTHGRGSWAVLQCLFKAGLCLARFPPRGAAFLRLPELFPSLLFGEQQGKNSFSSGAATGLLDSAVRLLCSALLFCVKPGLISKQGLHKLLQDLRQALPPP